MTDWREKEILALVDATEQASQRTRWSYLALWLASVVMITAQLSLYAPWAAFVQERISYGCEKGAEPCTSDRRQLSRVLWNEIYHVSIPALGLKINSDDLIVIGTGTLAALAASLWFCQRREYSVLKHLLRVSRGATCDPPLRSFIYSATAHHFVFNTTTTHDYPIEYAPRNTLPRNMVRALEWLPLLACAASVVAFIAIYTLPRMWVGWWLPDLLVSGTDSGRSPWELAADRPGGQIERLHFVARIVWGGLMTLMVMRITRDTVIYSDSVRRTLVRLRFLAPDHEKVDREKLRKNKISYQTPLQITSRVFCVLKTPIAFRTRRQRTSACDAKTPTEILSEAWSLLTTPLALSTESRRLVEERNANTPKSDT